MARVDMSVGGWDGWYYGPWGKARLWRIHAPTGETFHPDELLLVRQSERDVSSLQSQVKRLRSMQLPLSHDDFLQVESAYFILQGLLTMYSPAIAHTVFERRTAPRAFHLAGNNQAIFNQAP